MADEEHREDAPGGEPERTPTTGAGGADDIFADAVPAQEVLGGPSEPSVEGDGAASAAEGGDGDDDDPNADRIEPLYDGTLKAPWEGAEEQWLAAKAAGLEVPEIRPAPNDGEAADERGPSDAPASPEEIPESPGLVAAREMSAGHRLTVAALILCLLAGLGAVAWILDLKDATGHQAREIAALSERLEARQRQIAAIKESSEARVASLNAKLARLKGDTDPAARLLVDQLKQNLDIARQDLALADEEMTVAQLDRELEAADQLQRRHREEDARNAAAAQAAAAEPSSNPEEASGATAQEGDGDTDALDSLLAGAVKGTPGPAQKEDDQAREDATNSLPPAPGSDLQAAPSRDQVKAAMDLVAPRAKACAGEESGRILVKMQVMGATGRVTDVQVIDDRFKGTPVASCVAREVRQAKLPKFGTDTISIKYPFDL